ncbi:MAG: hypothetical protein PHN50_07995 [Bacteroidales bacterium]|nr:hypothetical protein [Bacteroidales bacterium]
MSGLFTEGKTYCPCITKSKESMKHIVTIAIIIFFSILQIKAQSDFRDGYFVKNDNDTIFGLIDYRGNKANAKKCVFKKDIDSEKRVFSPDEIKSFRFFDSKYFVSKTITVDDKTEQLFLEYLINGIVDMYYYRDDKGEHYLVDDGQGNLYELKNEEKEIIINNTTYLKDSKEYIGILKAIFNESPSISKKVENIDLSHKSLINITHEYHNEVCKDEECIIYEQKLPKVKRSFGLVVGINVMSISQSGAFTDEFYYLKNSRFTSKIYPSIGLYYKVNMPFVNERLYLYYECTYSRANLSTSNSYIEPVYNLRYFNDISLTQNALNNLGLIRYEFPKGKIRPTFQIGGFARFYFKNEVLLQT